MALWKNGEVFAKGSVSLESIPSHAETHTDGTDDISTMTGDSGAGGAKGLVPSPGAGDAAAGKFLKADATWEALSVGSGVSAYKNPKNADSKIFAPSLYLPFDANANDQSTRNRTPTITGTTPPAINTGTKKLGAGSLLVSASTPQKGYIGYGQADDFLFGTAKDWTASFWIYATANPVVSYEVVGKYRSDQSWAAGGRAIYVRPNGDLVWDQFGAVEEVLLANATDPVVTSSWNLIQVVHDLKDEFVTTGDVTVYLNGAKVQEVTISAFTVNETDHLFAGVSETAGGNNYYIDDLHLTEYALSPETIADMWDSGSGKAAPVADIV